MINEVSEDELARTVRARKLAGAISLAVGFIMLGLKMGGFLLTGSTAILSDALESVVHVVATGFALFSVVLAAQPPDRSHPYGHGKIEFFSAGFEGALIIIAAAAIIYEAVPAFFKGPTLQKLDVGLVVVASAGVINLFLGLYLIRVGKRTRSLTLEADGKHVLTDSYTSLGVLVGLALVMWTGWTILDPLVAVAVALNIVWTGGRLIFHSVRGLMDAAEPDVLEDAIEVLRNNRLAGWIDVHRLRILRMGDFHHLDLHLTVPRFWDIGRGHEEQELLEELLDQQLPGTSEASIHLDPCVDACCGFCGYEPCPIRVRPCEARREWTLTSAVAPASYLDHDND